MRKHIVSTLAGELGVNVLQTDTDVAWFANPYPALKLGQLAAHHLIVQPDLRPHRSTATPNDLPLRPVPNDHSALDFLEIPRILGPNEFSLPLYGCPSSRSPLRPGENRRLRRDNLGKELRVLEHARGVAGVARGLRRGGAAALELEHRTEHRRKSQERLRELHRCNKHAKSRG